MRCALLSFVFLLTSDAQAVPARAARAAGPDHTIGGMTLEYAYQDWCLSEFEAALGRSDDAAVFLRRSSNWRNVFDPATGWMRPRRPDGSWVEPFTPTCKGGACWGGAPTSFPPSRP